MPQALEPRSGGSGDQPMDWDRLALTIYYRLDNVSTYLEPIANL